MKPQEPYKKVISPSSLYKAICPRCTWMSYWHNLSVPANLAQQQYLSRLQEGAFDGIDSQLISPLLKKGWTTLYKGRIASQPIEINGVKTRWKFYGELDLLAANDDGTFSIIDGKVSMKKEPEVLINNYRTQLEAYVFMLENPESGEAKKISSIGLLQWRINGVVGNNPFERGFKVEETYIPVERRPEEFGEFIAKFISIIEGDFPESGPECYDCKFLYEIGFYE